MKYEIASIPNDTQANLDRISTQNKAFDKCKGS